MTSPVQGGLKRNTLGEAKNKFHTPLDRRRRTRSSLRYDPVYLFASSSSYVALTQVLSGIAAEFLLVLIAKQKLVNLAFSLNRLSTTPV